MIEIDYDDSPGVQIAPKEPAFYMVRWMNEDTHHNKNKEKIDVNHLINK